MNSSFAACKQRRDRINTLRDALGTQMNSIMDKLQQSEARVLSEVQRRVDLELEVRDKQQSAAVAEAKAGRRLASTSPSSFARHGESLCVCA